MTWALVPVSPCDTCPGDEDLTSWTSSFCYALTYKIDDGDVPASTFVPWTPFNARVTIRSLGSVVVVAAPPGVPFHSRSQLTSSSQDLKLLKHGHKAFWRAASLRNAILEESGQGVSEYAVVMSMVLLLALVGVSMISTEALDTLRKVAAALH